MERIFRRSTGNAVIFGHRGYGRDLGLIIHLSASTALGPDPNNKVLVATVEEALKIGADGVSIHVNVGAEDESHMLATLGEVSGAHHPLHLRVVHKGLHAKEALEIASAK